MIIYKSGSVFESSTTALGHCISHDCALSKGVAKEFRERFGGINIIREQSARVGEVAVLKHHDRVIYCLVTKWLYFQKPKLGAVASALREMKSHMLSNGISQVSLPKISSGLDKIPWYKVEGKLKEIFKDSPITVYVYTL